MAVIGCSAEPKQKYHKATFDALILLEKQIFNVQSDFMNHMRIH
jgi:hypothetical protein